jgi:hypothetical protein
VKRLALATTAVALTLAGCGGGGSTTVNVGAAKTFSLTPFSLHGHTISFTIQQPDGKPLTSFRTGSGPHTGVHLIVVRDDLAYIVHQHPPVGPGGRFTQAISFPAPGPYRVLVDVYPNVPGLGPNFQLRQSVTIPGAYHPKPLPALRPDQTIDGYHFAITGAPQLHAIQAAFLHATVTDPGGRPVTLRPWFGALAHAIFFRKGSLDYFHTHICAPGAVNCGSLPGVAASSVTGTSSAPGKLTIGVLLPLPGTWELFLQMKLRGRVITAPYTLQVS